MEGTDSGRGRSENNSLRLSTTVSLDSTHEPHEGCSEVAHTTYCSPARCQNGADSSIGTFLNNAQSSKTMHFQYGTATTDEGTRQNSQDNIHNSDIKINGEPLYKTHIRVPSEQEESITSSNYPLSLQLNPNPGRIPCEHSLPESEQFPLDNGATFVKLTNEQAIITSHSQFRGGDVRVSCPMVPPSATNEEPWPVDSGARFKGETSTQLTVAKKKPHVYKSNPNLLNRDSFLSSASGFSIAKAPVSTAHHKELTEHDTNFTVNMDTPPIATTHRDALPGYPQSSLYPGLPPEMLHHWRSMPMLRENLRDLDLQEYKEQMRNQLKCLLQRVTPIPGEDIVHVDLTDPEMIVDPEFLAFELNQPTQFDKAKYNLCEKSKFEDILYKTEDKPLGSICDEKETELKKIAKMKKCGLITVSGAAGLGKTSQLIKMALDWYQPHRDSYLKEFEFVLYIPVSDLSNSSASFVDVLFEAGTFPTHHKQRTMEYNRLQDFLEDFQTSDKLLIIIDGHNKCAQKVKILEKVINGEHGCFPRSTVIIAGRPYYMKNLKTRRQPDMVVDIAGITDANVGKLFQNILKADDTVKELQENCTKYMFDRSILRIPLFTLLTCFMFYTHIRKDITVCNHEMPMTTTELFHVILRVFLRIMGRRDEDEFAVSFQRSPLLDPNTCLPVEKQRFLDSLARMSYESLKIGKKHFDETDLKRFLLSQEEISAFGLLICHQKDNVEHCASRASSSGFSCSFRNDLFQDYMAAMHMSKELSTVNELFDICKNNETTNKVSADLGYGSSSSVASGELRKQVSTPKRSLLKKVTHGLHKFGKSRYCRREAVEHSEQCTLQKYKSETSVLVLPPKTKQAPTEHMDQTYLDKSYEVPDKMCLYNILNPFQHAVMFACGMNPKYTRRLLDKFGLHVKAKVCVNNSNKYDFGYEATLFCESYQEDLNLDFHHYLINLGEKSGTTIQFPTPYDEVVTSDFAFKLSNEQTLSILKRLYGVDIERQGLTGANIVHSEETVLEMNDPCLFQVYLLHRFVFTSITELRITGNYFPDFTHLAYSFPNLRQLVFQAVNLATMKRMPHITDQPDITQMESLSKIVIENCRASFPLKDCVLKVIESNARNFKTINLTGIKDEQYSNRLSTVIAHCSNITELTLKNSGIAFEEFQPTYMGETTLSNVLPTLVHLRHLDLSQNKISISFPGLVHVLGRCNIEVLIVARCKIDSTTFVHASEQLRHLPRLQHLDISGNLLQGAAKTLIIALNECNQLIHLNVAKCGIRPAHFADMADCLSDMSSLRCFIANENCIGGSLTGLLSLLPKSLHTLSVRHCNIDASKCREHVSGMLSSFTNLEHLDLQDNVLHTALDQVIQGLENAHISYLNLRRCSLKPCDFRNAAKSLPKLLSLKELVIGVNTMCHSNDDARDKLVKNLRRCKSLTKLVSCSMHGEHFTPAQLHKLKEGGKVNVICFLQQ